MSRTALSGFEGFSDGWWSRWRFTRARVGIRRLASSIAVTAAQLRLVGKRLLDALSALKEAMPKVPKP